MTPTPSSPPLNRDELADAALRGGAFTMRHTEIVDTWLGRLFEHIFAGDGGVALAATGGHGRGELAPHSDLDLLLVHDGALSAAKAQQFWYPIWDHKFKLGHAVRTVGETIGLARTDLETATALLSVRHLAGNHTLTARIADDAIALWRKDAKSWLLQLADAVDARHETVLDVAYALEPDLKDGRGGLRDVHAIEWSVAAGLGGANVDLVQLRAPYEVLLAARVELHRLIGRPGDRLHLQTQDDIANRLDLPDADMLMAHIASAARTISWASDDYWYDLRRSLNTTHRLFRRGDKAQNLKDGIIAVGGRVGLDAAAVDEFAVLRVAVAAAANRARIARPTLDLLASAAPLPEPWPAQALTLFVQLLSLGNEAVPVIETLDEVDLWCRLIPEWAPNRCKPQRNAYHRFTVDRHLLEAVANAATLAKSVERPDLLLIGALLHDIGKGYPGDHTDVGMELAATIGARIGLSKPDQETVVMMVEHHLLLPDIATRRDLDDPATLRWVAAQAGTIERLHLLAALTEADSIATGPAAWGPWKAGLVAQLVEGAQHILAGGDINELTVSPERLADQRRLMADAALNDEPVVLIDDDQLTVICADQPGLFSRVAGVLAISGLDVAEATASGENGMVLDRFRVSSGFATAIPWDDVERNVGLALRGRLALDARLAERARTYRTPQLSAHVLPPRVRVLNEASDDATVVEVTGPDSIGLLYRLTRALADLNLDILRAKVATMGTDAVDAFYVRDQDGLKLTDPQDISEVERALMHALNQS